MTSDQGKFARDVPAAAPAWHDSLLHQLARWLHRSPGAVVAVTILTVLVVGALVIPRLAGLDPLDQTSAPRLAPASWAHPFGADQLGRDLFARSLVGLQTSLRVAAVSALLGGLGGTIIGCAAGYNRGVADVVLMRFVDAMLAFPNVLLALTVIAVLGPTSENLTIAIALVNVPLFARIARASMLAERGKDYVLAARALGCSPLRIVFRHILINTMPALLVQMTLAIQFAILSEASLSYLGLGIQPPAPSLGNILAGGQRYILSGAEHYVLFPAILLAVLILSLNLLSDALNAALNRQSN